jgi:hypothetical protein
LNGGGKQEDCRSRCEGVGRREEREEDVHMTGTASKEPRRQSSSVARIGTELVAEQASLVCCPRSGLATVRATLLQGWLNSQRLQYRAMQELLRYLTAWAMQDQSKSVQDHWMRLSHWTGLGGRAAKQGATTVYKESTGSFLRERGRRTGRSVIGRLMGQKSLSLPR